MARFPLFDLGQQGRSARYSHQAHINTYVEVNKRGDRDQLCYYGRPGLRRIASLGETPIRGLYAVGVLLYVVHRGTFYSVNNAGTATSLGALTTTSGRVAMSESNGKVVVVDGTEGYTYDIATTTWAQIGDGDFPTANTVDYEGGYTLVDDEGTGNFYVSSLDDPTTWSALDFANAEGFPDDLVRVYVERGQVILFGVDSSEFWQNVGNADFPYQRIQGAVFEYGLQARWSIADVEQTICFLAKNRTGEVTVTRLNGYRADPIGGEEFTYLINQYTGTSDATGIGYTVDGHSFYQINFPSQKESWCISMRNGMATKLESGTEGGRHRAEIGEEWLGKTVVSDYEDGTLYRIESDEFTDNGITFAKEVRGRHFFGEDEISIKEIRLDFEVGVGTAAGAGDNPQCMLQVSKDGGQSWQPERWKEIGPVGAFRQRVVYRRFGQAYDWGVRARVSDPVKFVLTGAWVSAT